MQLNRQTGRQTDGHALLPVLAPQFGHADPPPLGLAPQQRGHPHHQPAPELLRVLIRAHARHREVLHRLQDRGGVATGLKLVQHLVVGDLERLSSGKRPYHLREGGNGVILSLGALPPQPEEGGSLGPRLSSTFSHCKRRKAG